MGTRKIDCIIQCQAIKLFNSMMLSTTRASCLYQQSLRNNIYLGLVNRVKEICIRQGLSFSKICTDRSYCKKVCCIIKQIPVNDGVVDSCRSLLNDFNEQNKELLKLLLRAF